MTDTSSPLAEAPPKSRVTADTTVRWLLVAVLVTVLVAWWQMSHRLTDLENNLSSNISSSSDRAPFPSSDPVQCWMFGVGVLGDQGKVDALAKGDSTNPCIQQALQGARGEYLTP